ncbi:type II secretion system minor pseudopilin GspJ [Sessilibacter corallicola]|uniref:type II secretion system minor pseudopilin GspJ n=1 Tax=Sessilibacter corallicola TaxID=2904075 RepID=UPI001E45C7E6|nr:type II secretion system minor pseudopilin GspJ [Sessilibacter corallicola]MCE2027970.1 type II secretion system minor pseudopilin GspJ [Sessilibacter corallicola]
MNKPARHLSVGQTPQAQGFSLIEVLVALAITATILTLAYQSLTSAIDGSEKTQAAMDEIDTFARAMHILESDFKHVVARDSVLFNVESPNGFGTDIDNEYLLKFNRAGRPNPAMLKRSALLRVGYRWSDNILYRDTWPEAEEAVIDDARTLELLRDVTDFEILYLPSDADDRDGPWVDSWPDRGTSGMPVAVEVTLETEEFGRMKRLFLLSTEANITRRSSDDDDGNGDGNNGNGNNGGNGNGG